MALGKYVLAAAGLGTAYAALPSGWGSGQTFDLSAERAIARLEAKRRVVEGSGLGSLRIASAGIDKGAVSIGVTRAGEARTVKCRVTVVAVSAERSRAETDCGQPSAGDQPMHRLSGDALAIVLREHVAATIEDRPYDVDGVADRMLAFVVVNQPKIAGSMAKPKD